MGGLCHALHERYRLTDYTEVEIHAGLAWSAARQRFPAPARILCGDVQVLDLAGETFDTVVSLSCVDWNLEPRRGLSTCWRLVRPGGRLVLTLRLALGPSRTDPAESFQFIHYGPSLPEDVSRLEIAPYVVFNAAEALSVLDALSPRPGDVYAHGYWGRPAATARTPYNRLVFAGLVVSKTPARPGPPALLGELPGDLLAALAAAGGAGSPDAGRSG